MGEPIQSFTDLRVYQMACDLDLEVFLETKSWPREEKYSLVDQIRRSSRSIGANLAESWAKRRYPAHFVSKLTDADGELQETMHWLKATDKVGTGSADLRQPVGALCFGRVSWVTEELVWAGSVRFWRSRQKRCARATWHVSRSLGQTEPPFRRSGGPIVGSGDWDCGYSFVASPAAIFWRRAWGAGVHKERWPSNA